MREHTVTVTDESGKVVYRREGCTSVAVGFAGQDFAGAFVRGSVEDLPLANAEIGAAIIQTCFGEGEVTHG